MSTFTSSLAKTCGLIGCVFLSNAVASIAAELVLQKVPPLTVDQAPGYPENLARYKFGAQVEAAPQSNPVANLQLSSKSEDNNTAEAALLLGDPTVGYALSNGNTTLLVSLSKIENIGSVSFSNHGAKGEVTIATSNAKLPADSPQWHQVAQQEITPEAVKAKIGPAEAKYVKLTFNVTEPGRIAALGVYSTPTVAAFTMPRARKQNLDQSENVALISYNLTDLHAKARALYVSSGDDVKQANDMIDDQPGTSFKFASSDATPTAVIDLGKTTTLRRISAIYSPRQGSVEFYVLQSLPGSQQEGAEETKAGGAKAGKGEAVIGGSPAAEKAPKSLHLDEGMLANLSSVGSVADDGSGRAAIDFPETSGRYIMVKWTPATPQDTPFSVAEIAGFGGGAKAGNLIAANTAIAGRERSERMYSDGKSIADGKDMSKDMSKEMPEEGPAAPAEGPPPPLPDPPPFTFVPLIVPTSP